MLHPNSLEQIGQVFNPSTKKSSYPGMNNDPRMLPAWVNGRFQLAHMTNLARSRSLTAAPSARAISTGLWRRRLLWFLVRRYPRL